jgi:hypothetical protein
MKTMQELIASLQSEQVTRLDTINIELAAIARSVQNMAHSLDGCNEKLADENLSAAHAAIIEAVYCIGQCAGALRSDAAIDISAQLIK